MRSARTRQRSTAWALAIACAVGGLGAVAAVPEQALTREQVNAAVERLRADPNLPGTRTERKLRFKDRGTQEEETKKKDGSLGWLRDLVKTIAEGARWLIWGLGALLFAWVLLRIRGWVRVRAEGARPARGPLPSHVGSLDIRPESLPDDIGLGAAELWRRGRERAALSLLYRGALSRLVHVHAVPVRAASTEGECVALASGRLAPAAHGFFVALVDAWQLAAYSGRLPSTAQVLAVCGEFDRHLSPAAAPAEVLQ